MMDKLNLIVQCASVLFVLFGGLWIYYKVDKPKKIRIVYVKTGCRNRCK